MSLSRKRRKELEKLRSSALELWSRQQDVLERANSVAREASRQAGHLTREEVRPRVREGYETYVKPGFEATKDMARDSIDRNVVPALGATLGTILSIGDVAKDARVRSALRRVGQDVVVQKQKSGPGFGTVVLVTAGVIAAAGVAYAVWQTFRADDELWIADEPYPSTGSTVDESPSND